MESNLWRHGKNVERTGVGKTRTFHSIVIWNGSLYIYIDPASSTILMIICQYYYWPCSFLFRESSNFEYQIHDIGKFEIFSKYSEFHKYARETFSIELIKFVWIFIQNTCSFLRGMIGKQTWDFSHVLFGSLINPESWSGSGPHDLLILPTLSPFHDRLTWWRVKWVCILE
jgi:hypothetical protein